LICIKLIYQSTIVITYDALCTIYSHVCLCQLYGQPYSHLFPAQLLQSSKIKETSVIRTLYHSMVCRTCVKKSSDINNRACGVAFYVMGWFPYATGQIDDSSSSCLGRTMIRTMTFLMPPSMHYNNSYSLGHLNFNRC